MIELFRIIFNDIKNIKNWRVVKREVGRGKIFELIHKFLELI